MTMRIRKPRCYLLYALAPESMTPQQVNQRLNAICGDRSLPLSIYHDHFIGQPGGLIIFFAENQDERQALESRLPEHLAGWQWSLHPLIFSRNPAALDEQIRFTLAAYRDQDWDTLRLEERPTYGDPTREAETATESD
jgi:hypothetical protein